MKVVVDREALVEAVGLAIGSVNARASRPILECVKVTGKDGCLSIEGTTLETSIRVTTEKIDLEIPGSFVVPASKFHEICRQSEDPTLTIECKDDTIWIIGSDSKFKVFGYPPADFPEIPAPEGYPPLAFEMTCGQMQSLLDRTKFCTARENTRYAVSGVLMSCKGKKASFVATDGRRLSLASCMLDVAPKASKINAIVPMKSVSLVLRLISDPADKIKVHIGEGAAIFIVGDGGQGAMIYTTLVEGTFPPYEDVIPSDLDKKAVLECQTTLSALSRSALLTNEETKGVLFSFSKEGLTLKGRAPEIGESEIQHQLVSWDGEPVESCFDPRFLIEAIKAIGSERVSMKVKSPNKPCLLEAENFTYVCMPMSYN